MPEINLNKDRGIENRLGGVSPGQFDPQQDLLAEKILENINCTPIGQLLKRIAFLPKIRAEKVITIRRQISQNQYDLNNRLDVVLDKVLEELVL